MAKNKNTPSRIIITEARQAVGMTCRNGSDEQIDTIIDIMFDAAKYAFKGRDGHSGYYQLAGTQLRDYSVSSSNISISFDGFERFSFFGVILR